MLLFLANGEVLAGSACARRIGEVVIDIQAVEGVVAGLGDLVEPGAAVKGI